MLLDPLFNRGSGAWRFPTSRCDVSRLFRLTADGRIPLAGGTLDPDHILKKSNSSDLVLIWGDVCRREHTLSPYTCEGRSWSKTRNDMLMALNAPWGY